MRDKITLIYGHYAVPILINDEMFKRPWDQSYAQVPLNRVVIPTKYHADPKLYLQIRGMILDDSVTIEWSDLELDEGTIPVKVVGSSKEYSELRRGAQPQGGIVLRRQPPHIDTTRDEPLVSDASEVCRPGEDQHSGGAKCDAGKNRIALIMSGFHRALMAVGRLGTIGAEKYSEKGFLDVVSGEARYSDAMLRHWFAEQAGLEFDDGPGGTGEMHATCVAWNALARLEFILRDKEK